MWPTVTNRVAWSVGLSDTLVSSAKTAAPIEMPFGLRTWVGPGNHVLDGSSDPPLGRGNFEGEGASQCKVQGYSVVICAKSGRTNRDTVQVVGLDEP